MRKIQRKIVQLAFEIESVCLEFDMPYALYGKTCASAVQLGGFAHNECQLHLMVRARDLPLLESALEALDLQDRAVESLKTNPRLAFNELRYVDTSTTLLCRDEPVRYEHIGAAVIVHPVFAARPPKPVSLAFASLAYANGGLEYCADLLQPALRPAMRLAWQPTGLRAMARLAYAALARDARAEGPARYVFHNGDFVKAPGPLLERTRPAQFSGREFPVPEAAEALMEKLYGAKWAQTAGEPCASSEALATICDPSTPYSELDEYLSGRGSGLRDVQETLYRNFRLHCDEFNPWRLKKSRLYSYALLARDRIDYYVGIEGDLDKLREASQEGDTDRLRELLGRYFHFTRKYLRRNLGFFTTQEIFDMAAQVWRAGKGGDAYAGKVYALVPEQHRSKDLKAHIDRYRQA